MMTRIVTLLVFLYAGGVMLFYSYILLTKKDNRLFRGFNRVDSPAKNSPHDNSNDDEQQHTREISLKEHTTHTAGRWLETVAILCAVTGILCFFFPAHTKIFAAVFGIILVVSMLLLAVFAKIVK
jgi:hypothetical protein